MFGFLWRQRISSSCSAMLVGLAGSIAYVQWATPLYQATARITVEPVPGTGGAFHGDDTSIDRFLTFQRDRLVSRSVLAMALADANVKPLETFRDSSNRLSVCARVYLSKPDGRITR